MRPFQKPVFDLNFKSERDKELTKEEKIQYEKDRDRFCLSDEEWTRMEKYLKELLKKQKSRNLPFRSLKLC